MKMPHQFSAVKLIPLNKNDFLNSQILKDKTLLIFENNMTFEFSDFKEHKFKKILLVLNDTNRAIKLSEKVLKFKANLLEDQKIRLELKNRLIVKLLTLMI